MISCWFSVCKWWFQFISENTKNGIISFLFLLFCPTGRTSFEFKGWHYHYSIMYYPRHRHQKHLTASCHPHIHNRLQASCRHLIPMQAKKYHPLNLTLTKNLNQFATKIRGKIVQFLKQYCRIYLFNAFCTTQPLFFVTLYSGTPTAKSAFLTDITMLQNISFAALISLRDFVHAIDSTNVININC